MADPKDPASKLDQLALEALRAGNAALAAKIAAIGEDVREYMASLARGGLRSADVQSTVEPMDAQTARRARGLARAAATNDLYRAIADDPQKRWRSGADYARRRLKISPASLTGYCNGTTPAPARVDRLVRTDFPGLAWTWKKGVVD